jgi:HTH-type transcriptional regulator/antitoxin HigA
MHKPIKSKKEYELALKTISGLMQRTPKKGSRQADELELLSVLVNVYEREQFPISIPNPVAAIQFRMEQGKISESALTAILGGRSRKSEILLGKRKLSLSMIRALHTALHIPAENLIADY